MKNENYHRASHCKYLVQYHIIWCPKFRCDGMDETLKKILSEVCDAYGGTTSRKRTHKIDKF